MEDQALEVINSTVEASGQLMTAPTKGGDIIRQVAGAWDANPTGGCVIAAAVVIGVGYLAYKAFSDKE